MAHHELRGFFHLTYLDMNLSFTMESSWCVSKLAFGRIQSKRISSNLDVFFFQVKMYTERIAEDTHSLLAVDGHIPACGDNKDAWR